MCSHVKCQSPRVATYSSDFLMFFSILISFHLLDIDHNSSFEFCSCFKSWLALANGASCWFSHFNMSLKTAFKKLVFKVLETLY